MTDTRIEIVHWREAWYAEGQQKGWGDWIDEVAIHVVDAGTGGIIGGEVMIRWYPIGTNEPATPRLEVFSDGWQHLGCNAPLHHLVELLHGWEVHKDALGPLEPDVLCYLLTSGSLDATDTTPRERIPEGVAEALA